MTQKMLAEELTERPYNITKIRMGTLSSRDIASEAATVSDLGKSSTRSEHIKIIGT